MVVMPIPRSLLPHSATKKPFIGQGDWGNEQYGAEIQLKHVRFEPSSKLIADKENKQRNLSAVMFFDCRNSLPKGASFSEEDKIAFGSLEFTVAAVYPHYTTGTTPHHYEIGLI